MRGDNDFGLAETPHLLFVIIGMGLEGLEAAFSGDLLQFGLVEQTALFGAGLGDEQEFAAPRLIEPVIAAQQIGKSRFRLPR